MAIKRFLFCFLSCLHVCQSYFDLFNDNLFESDKIKNFIKDQFQENCFGVKSFSMMNSHVRTAKILCASNPSKPTATTSLTPSLPTSTSTKTTRSASTLTTSRWSWMPPLATQSPAFQNVHLVNPFQFYPQSFQYKVTVLLLQLCESHRVIDSVSRLVSSPFPECVLQPDLQPGEGRDVLPLHRPLHGQRPGSGYQSGKNSYITCWTSPLNELNNKIKEELTG